MKCYICERTQQPGGMHYEVRQAVGICQHCGIGVCLEHSHKDAELGAPLLCKACAELAVHQTENYTMTGAHDSLRVDTNS